MLSWGGSQSMNRKDFLQGAFGTGCCVFAAMNALNLPAGVTKAVSGPANQPTDDQEQEFVQNWLADLLSTIQTELDRETQVRLIEGCGRGCFQRHSFKQDIAADGAGDVDRLIEALKRNFEVWREGDLVHIRYGEESPGCYCPAARYREPEPNDLHCECSRTSHQTIWETAIGHPFTVDILESVRRGDKTCHFLVHLT